MSENQRPAARASLEYQLVSDYQRLRTEEGFISKKRDRNGCKIGKATDKRGGENKVNSLLRVEEDMFDKYTRLLHLRPEPAHP